MEIHLTDQEVYEADLKRRQSEHLLMIDRNKRVNEINPLNNTFYIESPIHGFKPAWRPCLHDQCPKCLGTGMSLVGPCNHYICCTCPKCSFY